MFLQFFPLIILFIVLTAQGIPLSRRTRGPPGPGGISIGADGRPRRPHPGDGRGPENVANGIAAEVATRTVTTQATPTHIQENQQGEGGGLTILQQKILIGTAIGCICLMAIAVAAFFVWKRRRSERQRVRFSVVTPGFRHRTRSRPTPRKVTITEISAPVVLDLDTERRSVDSSTKPALPPGLDVSTKTKKKVLSMKKA